MFIPIKMLEAMRNDGLKSIKYNRDVYVAKDGTVYHATEILGKKKRLYFDYDMQTFLEEMES